MFVVTFGSYFTCHERSVNMIVFQGSAYGMLCFAMMMAAIGRKIDVRVNGNFVALSQL